MIVLEDAICSTYERKRLQGGCILLMLPILRQRRLTTIVAVTLAVAIVLSITSFQFYNATASQITEIAKRDIRNNALIEAEGLSNSLENKITGITSIMQVIAAAQSVESGDISRAQSLFEGAQASTKGLTDGYYWLDKDGIIVTYSEVNTGKFPEYRGNSLADRDYFTVPRDEHRPHMTSLKESNVDNVTRIYIGYPILGGNSSNIADGSGNSEFHGVIVAAIHPKNLGAFMQSQIPKQFSSTAGLMDKEASILYTTNEQFIGTNYFDGPFRSEIPEQIRDDFDTIVKRSLSGTARAEDLSLPESDLTLAYSPVVINGEHVWTAYIGYPHELAGEVGALVDQQRNFSIVIILAIAAVAALVASLVISWNSGLQIAVKQKTSELRQAVDSLARANIQLQEHDKMQQEFINVAAHELRTPIQPILGVSELLNDEFARNAGKQEIPVDRETAEMIFRNAKRLERLSSDILQVTRIEGNRLKLDKEVFDLNMKVQNVVHDTEATLAHAGAKKVSIKMNLSEMPLNIWADKSKIYEVVANLLGNAIKFTRAAAATTPDGTIQIETTIITENGNGGKTSSRAAFRIIDNGKGIDPEIMPRLFTKFATKSDQGTGLGLYISKSIIEAHGGKIWAENNSSKGATFAFTLPLASMQQEADNNSSNSITGTSDKTMMARPSESLQPRPHDTTIESRNVDNNN